MNHAIPRRFSLGVRATLAIVTVESFDLMSLDSPSMTDKENEMKRIYATFVTSITLALLAPTAWAGGPTAASPGRVEGTIQSVDPAQQRIVLADGTELTVASPALLEQIEPARRSTCSSSTSTARRWSSVWR